MTTPDRELTEAREAGGSMDAVKRAALKTLSTIVDRNARYEALNKEIRALQGDFHGHMTMIDTEVEAALVTLLDAVLGDEVASYFLYEARNMKGGGVIHNDGGKWPIRSLADVEAYVTRNTR